MDLLKVKATIEAKKEERATVKGRLEEVQGQLKDKFKVKSLKEAKALLETKEQEIATLTASYEAKQVEFKANFGELVGI
jgi:hypothetical protein